MDRWRLLEPQSDFRQPLSKPLAERSLPPQEQKPVASRIWQVCISSEPSLAPAWPISSDEETLSDNISIQDAEWVCSEK